MPVNPVAPEAAADLTQLDNQEKARLVKIIAACLPLLDALRQLAARNPAETEMEWEGYARTLRNRVKRLDVDLPSRFTVALSVLLDQSPYERAATYKINPDAWTTNIQELIDGLRDQLANFKADNKADKLKKKLREIPENPAVSRLAKEINKKRNATRSKIDVAREFTEGNEKEAKNLLRQLRRFPSLLS